MSSTNLSNNRAAIKKFREELSSMLDDIAEIDKKVLNKAMIKGIRVVKEQTPVDTGHLQRNWHFTRPKNVCNGVESELYNNVEYAVYVNYGHRIVRKKDQRAQRKIRVKKHQKAKRKIGMGKKQKAQRKIL